MNRLNLRETKFVAEYLKCANGARAARLAGYSKRTAHVKAAQLLAKVSIFEAVEKGRKGLCHKLKIDRERIIQEIAVIAFSNILHYMSWDNTGVTVYPSEEIDFNYSVAIKKVKKICRCRGGGIEIELHGKLQALWLLVKILGFDKKPIRTSNDEEDSKARSAWLTGVIERVRRGEEARKEKEKRDLCGSS